MNRDPGTPSEESPGRPPCRPLTCDSSGEVGEEIHDEDGGHTSCEHTGVDVEHPELVDVSSGRISSFVYGLVELAGRWG